MGIVIELRAPEKGCISRLVPPADVDGWLEPARSDGFALLRWIDSYGDTEFSQLQMRGLLPELSRLQRKATSDVVSRFIGDVLDLAEKCSALPHHKLVFVGD